MNVGLVEFLVREKSYNMRPRKGLQAIYKPSWQLFPPRIDMQQPAFSEQIDFVVASASALVST